MHPMHFGRALDSTFSHASRGTGHGEVALFRALQTAIQALSTSFKIAEFHGTGHQVAFPGGFPWSRPVPRCELCDLAIVTYRRPPTPSIRLTFFQAKLEKAAKALLRRVFDCNLEQWDLLCNRPAILGTATTFQPPPDLLSGALLRSVGTFGFFYRAAGAHQIFYAAADQLAPHGTPKRYGKVKASAGVATRMVHSFYERTLATNTIQFGTALAGSQIGTPIEAAGGASDAAYRAAARLWLKNSLLSSLGALGGQQDDVVNGLLETIGDSGNPRNQGDGRPVDRGTPGPRVVVLDASSFDPLVPPDGTRN